MLPTVRWPGWSHAPFDRRSYRPFASSSYLVVGATEQRLIEAPDEKDRPGESEGVRRIVRPVRSGSERPGCDDPRSGRARRRVVGGDHSHPPRRNRRIARRSATRRIVTAATPRATRRSRWCPVPRPRRPSRSPISARSSPKPKATRPPTGRRRTPPPTDSSP